MMEIVETPGNYRAAYGELLYRIEEVEADDLLEVAVYGGAGNELLGLKRFRGESSYVVNTASYLQPLLEVNPVGGEMGFVIATGRIVKTYIGTGDILSESSLLTAGTEDARPETLLSHAPSRVRIGTEERDELAVIAPGKQLLARIRLAGSGQSTEIQIDGPLAGDDMYVFVLQVSEVLSMAGEEWSSRCRRLEVEIQADEVVIATRYYDVVPRSLSSMRLCWLNPLGAVDYYTFPEETGRSLSVEKRRAYGRQGYGIYGSQAEMTYVLRSEHEPIATMRWLAELVGSPRVWRLDGDEAVPVDIVSDSVCIRGGDPGLLEVTVRAPKRLEFQKDGWR